MATPDGCIMGFTGKHYYTSLTDNDQSVVMLVLSVVKMKQQPGTMDNYNFFFFLVSTLSPLEHVRTVVRYYLQVTLKDG